MENRSSSMEEWSLDTINEYCEKHFGGKILCELSETKGRIMVAQQDFPQGEILFSEPPLHIAQEDEDNEAFCALRDLYNGDQDSFDYEPLWYWAALVSLTEEQLKKGPRIGTLPSVTATQQRQLLCLYHEPVTEASDPVKRILKKIGLKVSAVLVEELLQAWILNCFEHSEDPQGYSAYFASSFASHSCRPNAIWREGEDALHILRAREEIAKGDEITISYLEEHVLLQSAESRIKSLQDTKLFVCGCERCAPAPDAPADDLGTDRCRGFHCRSCGECAVFHRLRPRGKGEGKGKGKGLRGVKCTACGAQVQESEAVRLAQRESDLRDKLDALDEQVSEKGIGKVMQENRAQSLLRLVASGESGPIGPQHWLCDRLWEHLQGWYGSRGNHKEQRRLQKLRVDYQRKAYPGLSGTLAWTLEEQADTLLRHLGFGAKMLQSDGEHGGDMAAQVKPALEESLRIFRLMFGKDDENSTKVQKKLHLAEQFLAKRASQGAGP